MDRPEISVRSALWGSDAQGKVASGRQQQVSAILQSSDLGFNDFSTNKYLGSGPGGWDSLESIHDTIHGSVGRGGHMSSLDIAGFDPIFWMHHWYVCSRNERGKETKIPFFSMVDRLMYIWQKNHPNQYIKPVPISANTLRRNPRTTFAGEEINKTTPLWPFWHTDSDFWTSELAENTTRLGYTYDTADKTPKQWRQAVQQMFPDISATTTSLEPAQPDETEEPSGELLVPMEGIY